VFFSGLNNLKMGNLKRTLLRPLISIIPFSIVKQTSAEKLLILYYHIISDDDLPHVKNLYEYKRTLQFIDDLNFLLRNYEPISVAEVIQNEKKDIPYPTDRFLLTFDDGFREIYDVIAPILLDKGIPAAFFISSAFLDNRELCYEHKASLLVESIRKGISPATEAEVIGILWKIGVPFSKLSDGVLKVDYSRRDALDRIAEVLQIDFQEYLNEKQPYLTSDQVKGLIDRGFAIGAHSIDHPYYSALSLAEQLEQTMVSVKLIRDKFGLGYGAFAFPHTDAGVDEGFFKKVQESGLVDITFGTGGMLCGCIRRHRQRTSLEKPLRPAREIIAWQYARKLYRRIRGDLKEVETD
jgi:peptidoglycan/xylan/chitin deacetylase (PgdA/CDA1 family)